MISMIIAVLSLSRQYTLFRLGAFTQGGASGLVQSGRLNQSGLNHTRQPDLSE
jgi:hypothetical protein